MARELGVDINEVTGPGPGGRITKDNIRNYARSIILNASGPAGRPAPPLPDFSRWGEIERKPMSGIRRKTAEHVQDAWSIPHVTHFVDTDRGLLVPVIRDVDKNSSVRNPDSTGGSSCGRFRGCCGWGYLQWDLE
jgi:pyruvate/2-oxoglutarate dehydrogenase complex dihydrolipoamide acyltransferase (E2) component